MKQQLKLNSSTESNGHFFFVISFDGMHFYACNPRLICLISLKSRSIYFTSWVNNTRFIFHWPQFSSKLLQLISRIDGSLFSREEEERNKTSKYCNSKECFFVFVSYSFPFHLLKIHTKIFKCTHKQISQNFDDEPNIS